MRAACLVAGLLVAALAVVPAASAHGYAIARDWGTLGPGLTEAALDEFGCRELTNCQDLLGLSVLDYNISAEMAEAHEGMLAENETDYTVRAYLYDYATTRYATAWALCQYDANRTLLGCNETSLWYTWPWSLRATVDKDAHHLRVILKNNAYATYYLSVTTAYNHNA